MTKSKPFVFLFLGLLLASFCFLFAASNVYANPPGITLTSVDSSGTQTETYNVGDAICISGSGFAPLTTYDVYVVDDVTWTDGMTIPARVSGSVTTVTTDASGTFSAYPVWPNAQAGVSDIVIDMNGDGVYNVDVDAIDEDHTTGNLLVAPEYPLYGLLAIFACFAAFVTFKAGHNLKINLHKG
jgi:hypothetical protein